MRRLLPVLAILALLHLGPAPAQSQEVDGSVPAALVGGIAAGTAALWAFYPFSGCHMVTIGAARPSDICDVASVVALLGGTATGAVLGAKNRHIGYGMGIGWVAGFGTQWLLGKVVDTPRWLDALVLVGGVVAGGVLGSEYADDPDPDMEPAQLEVFRIDLIRF